MEKEDLSQLKISRNGSASALLVRPQKKGRVILIVVVLCLIFIGIL